MNNAKEVISLFSIPVTKININRSFTESEIQCIANIPIENDEKKGMTNHRSKDYYLFNNFSETLYEIQKFCEQQLENYLKEIEGVDTDLATLRITQSWLNNTKPNEYHQPHAHRNSYLAGVLYISCLPNDHIVFSNVMYRYYKMIEFPKKKQTVWNSEGASVNVKEGDLILFPSWMIHYVDMNKTKDVDRLSLSFNTFPKGELGTYFGATHLKL